MDLHHTSTSGAPEHFYAQWRVGSSTREGQEAALD